MYIDSKNEICKKIYKDRKTIFVDKLFSQAIIDLFARQKQLCFGRTEEWGFRKCNGQKDW